MASVRGALHVLHLIIDGSVYVRVSSDDVASLPSCSADTAYFRKSFISWRTFFKQLCNAKNTQNATSGSIVLQVAASASLFKVSKLIIQKVDGMFTLDLLHTLEHRITCGCAALGKKICMAPVFPAASLVSS